MATPARHFAAWVAEAIDAEIRTLGAGNMETSMLTLKQLLEEVSQVDGVRAAVVVSRDGFLIEGIAASGELDSETLGAAVSTGIVAAETTGRDLSVGAMIQSMTEYDQGIVLVSLLGPDAVLAVVARLGANLGNVRYQVRKRSPEILALL
jgi:uncharacterized protein